MAPMRQERVAHEMQYCWFESTIEHVACVREMRQTMGVTGYKTSSSTLLVFQQVTPKIKNTVGIVQKSPRTARCLFEILRTKIIRGLSYVCTLELAS